MPMPPDIPNYDMLRKIGEGGMAEVWLAEHKRNRRRSAIKVLRKRDEFSDAESEELFLREGEILASFTDPNIVAIYDNDRIDGLAYIAMEYIAGGTLTDRMKRGNITVAEAIGLVVQIASALGAAHRCSIVHRDLKPENILMRDKTTPVLTDFGASRMADRKTIFSKDGGTVGTPTYMSPEQVTGAELDGRSDLYALGVLFFELLTGMRPFRGGTFTETATQHLYAPIPRLPDYLAPLQGVISKLLAKQPADRFADAQSFIDALRVVVLGEVTLRRQVAEISDIPEWTSQLRALGFIVESNDPTEIRSALQRSNSEAIAALGPDVPRRRVEDVHTGRMPSLEVPPTRRRWVGPLVAVALIAVSVADYLVYDQQQHEIQQLAQAAPRAAAAQSAFIGARAEFVALAARLGVDAAESLREPDRLSTGAMQKLNTQSFAAAEAEYQAATLALRSVRTQFLSDLRARLTAEFQVAVERDTARAEQLLEQIAALDAEQ